MEALPERDQQVVEVVVVIEEGPSYWILLQ
jgi:hypothetical protein